MRDEFGPRAWGARVLAPLAFFTAATILVLIVHRSLTTESEGSARPAAATGTQTQATTATSPTTTGAKQPRRFYRIRDGDTFGAIAERFRTTVEELTRLNPNVDPNALTPGQRIRVR